MLFSISLISAPNKTNNIWPSLSFIIPFLRSTDCPSYLTAVSFCILYKSAFTLRMSYMYMRHSLITFCLVHFVGSSNFCVRMRSVHFTYVKPFTAIKLLLSLDWKRLIFYSIVITIIFNFLKEATVFFGKTNTPTKLIFIGSTARKW